MRALRIGRIGAFRPSATGPAAAAPDQTTLRSVYAGEIDSHLSAVSPETRTLLHRLVERADFPGASDPGALAVLLTIVRSIQPRLILELGTHIGVGSVCIADVLERNKYVKGQLVTVEPNPHARAAAIQAVAEAGLSHRVRFLDGLSTDPKIGEQLRAEGAFDIAYLDSSHSYDGTIAELGLLFGPNGWLGERGLLVAHDVAAEAADFDPTGAGGVPRALAEWVSDNGDAYQCFALAPPLWPCACGVGLVSRRELPLARPTEAT